MSYSKPTFEQKKFLLDFLHYAKSRFCRLGDKKRLFIDSEEDSNQTKYED